MCTCGVSQIPKLATLDVPGNLLKPEEARALGRAIGAKEGWKGSALPEEASVVARVEMGAPDILVHEMARRLYGAVSLALWPAWRRAFGLHLCVELELLGPQCRADFLAAEASPPAVFAKSSGLGRGGPGMS